MNFKPGLRVILDDMQVTPFADIEGWIGRADATTWERSIRIVRDRTLS